MSTIRPPPPPPWISEGSWEREASNRVFIKNIMKTGLFRDQAPLLEVAQRTMLGITPASGVYGLRNTDFILVVSVKKYWLRKGAESVHIGFGDVLSNVDEDTQTQLLFHLELLRNVQDC